MQSEKKSLSAKAKAEAAERERLGLGPKVPLLPATSADGIQASLVRTTLLSALSSAQLSSALLMRTVRCALQLSSTQLMCWGVVCFHQTIFKTNGHSKTKQLKRLQINSSFLAEQTAGSERHQKQVALLQKVIHCVAVTVVWCGVVWCVGVCCSLLCDSLFFLFVV